MSTTQSARLGGSASDVSVFKIGYGLMMIAFTNSPTAATDEQAFEAIKTAIALTPSDRKLFINSAEFYSPDLSVANLLLVARFFTKYPELADRCFLSVKGGMVAGTLKADGSPANLRRSVDAILAALDGKKKFDLFQCARVDPAVSLESVYGTLKELRSEGKFDHIGISEVNADTLRKANEIVPIAAVEIEVSPWTYEEPGKRVIETSKELGIAVIAYSPLGKGFLTGKLNLEELPKGDFRRHFARFQDEAMIHNQKIVDALTKIAEKKGITNAQLSLAWVSSLGPHVIPLPGTSKASRVKENMFAGEVVFTEEELAEIREVMEKHKPQGGRYTDGAHGPELLWS